MLINKIHFEGNGLKMTKFTYGQLTQFVTYYLEMYPHVGVALEATLEDVEGDGVLATEVRTAMESIYAGKSDVEVLTDWSTQTGSRDLEKLAASIVEARSKGIDIGLFLRKPKAPKRFDKNRSKGRSNGNFRKKRTYNN